jgi:DNA-binding response OmpR family regulator
MAGGPARPWAGSARLLTPAALTATSSPRTEKDCRKRYELAVHPGQPVAKSRLLPAVWGYDFDPGSNVMDVCVRRLRSKFGFGLIETVRGEGYRLAD